MNKTIMPLLSQSVIPPNKQQCLAIEVKTFTLAHDRFLIDDDIYHIGASLKDLGKKWFAFSKMEMGAIEMLGRVGV
jgi:hypothetical protein